MGDPKPSIPDDYGRVDEPVFEDTPLVELSQEAGAPQSVPEKGVDPRARVEGAPQDERTFVAQQGFGETIKEAPPRPETKEYYKLSIGDRANADAYWTKKLAAEKESPKRVDEVKKSIDALYERHQ